MEGLKNRLEEFAKSVGLLLYITSYADGDYSFDFIRACDSRHLKYTVERGCDYEKTYDHVIKAVTAFFVGAVEEECTDDPNSDIPVYASELTKQEHIALELTKAWAASNTRNYHDPSEIVETYVDILEEVKRSL